MRLQGQARRWRQRSLPLLVRWRHRAAAQIHVERTDTRRGRLGGPFLFRLEERNVGDSSLSSLRVSPARKIPARESNAWHNAMEFESYIKANGHLQSAESIAICVLVVYLSSANRLFLAVTSSEKESQTHDEAAHIAAGYSYWKTPLCNIRHASDHVYLAVSHHLSDILGSPVGGT